MIHTGELLARNARKFPDREALVFEDKRFSYGELNEMVNRLSNSLIELGIRKGDKVGMMSFNSDSFVIAYFAIMKAGGIVVPLNFRLAPPEVEYILDNCDAKAFLFGNEFLPIAKELRDKLPRVERWILMDGEATEDFLYSPKLTEEGNPAEPGVDIHLFDESAIIYTSGTTGRPKGAVFNHYSHLSIATAMMSEVSIREYDRILHVAPLFHSAELHLYLWPGTFAGATHVVLKFFIPKLVLETIEKERITQFFGAPAMYLLMMQEPDFHKYDLSSVKYWAYGAAPMSREQVLKAIEMFKTDQFFCLCGLTEGGPGGVRLRPEDQITKAGAGGLPVVNCESRVVNEKGEDVAVGEVGEWLVRCESNMLYYYKNPEATAETLTPDGWVRTGDLAVVDEDGYVTLVDRKKDMIISGGENIYPREIENVLLAHPKVADAAVVGVPHEIYGETVKAFVVPAEGEEVAPEELREFCVGKLGDFKIPRLWEFIDALPRNPSGKVMKYVLREKK
jgi:acyl-CoA synthetase (AMP-forming)/AMP-acid ligase II